jgi:hypothetical protein
MAVTAPQERYSRDSRLSLNSLLLNAFFRSANFFSRAKLAAC